MPFVIRSEQPSDDDAISALLKAAFENHPFSQNNEYLMVKALREANALTLSCVAQDDGGKIVGHIVFSEATIDGKFTGWYTLGPLAALPEKQGAGIGRALMQHGLEHMQKMGAAGIVLVGDPDYYQRFGFKHYPGMVIEGIPAQYVMAYSFGTATPEGRVKHHEVFSAFE